MPWKNFNVWHGRLPHWRADDVTYYVTFRHRRALTEAERQDLFYALQQPDGRRWDLLILCVLPEQTDLMFRVREAPSGEPYELSDIVEKAKTKAGKLILKRTEERFPPFYTESFDRIVRDQVEFDSLWQTLVTAPVVHELVEDPKFYPTLWWIETTDD